jgi:DNA excision repair protein ERCC-3
MAPAAKNALVIQSDCSVLLEVNSPRADEARAALAPFAELVKSPEHVHTYRLTPLSIWNARATGLAAERMVTALREHTRYPVPSNVEQEIFELAARYGRVVIVREGDDLRCTCQDLATAERIARDKEAGQYLARRTDATSFSGYVAGEPFDFVLRETSAAGTRFQVRDYQR